MPSDAQTETPPLLERLRESLALICAAGLAIGLAFGLVLGQVDAGLVAGDGGDQITLVTGLLSAILTVTGVVLSVLVVAQQLASQQYSPRAIRTALRDPVTRGTLSGVFAYVGLLLGALMTLDPEASGTLAVSAAVVLSAVALGLVVLVIQRVTNGFRSERLVRRIASDALAAVDRIERREDAADGDASDPLTAEDVPSDATVVAAPRAGYLQDVDVDALASRLASSGARVLLEVPLGSFVARAVPIGHAWSMGAGAATVHDATEVESALSDGLRIGTARTTEREIGSDVQQLVDIALRALSPAINDPYTAIEAVNQATSVLQQLAEREQRPVVGRADGNVVVTVPRPLVWDLAASVVDQIRLVAGGFPTVVESLVMLLRGIAAIRPGESDRALAHLDHVEAEVEGAGLIEVDRRWVAELLEKARAEIGRTTSSA